MKIAFTTEYGGNYAAIAGYTIPIMRKYCELHGYDLRVLVMEGTGNEYAYKKHEFFEQLFKEDYEAIFYLDVDAVITNMNVKIESFMDGFASLYITEHLGELNGGALILRNDEEGRWVNDLILSERGSFDNEQNVINFYRNFQPFIRAMKVVPHPAFNSFDYILYPEHPDIRERERGHWHEGDFVLHVPGLGIDHRLQVLKSTKITNEF